MPEHGHSGTGGSERWPLRPLQDVTWHCTENRAKANLTCFAGVTLSVLCEAGSPKRAVLAFWGRKGRAQGEILSEQRESKDRLRLELWMLEMPAG